MAQLQQRKMARLSAAAQSGEGRPRRKKGNLDKIEAVSTKASLLSRYTTHILFILHVHYKVFSSLYLFVVVALLQSSFLRAPQVLLRAHPTKYPEFRSSYRCDRYELQQPLYTEKLTRKFGFAFDFFSAHGKYFTAVFLVF